ncbi:MAG: precorrin-8X methylmutase [Treponema sp.]|nr:precorrin-8X methylmutase [Treponema sp.]
MKSFKHVLPMDIEKESFRIIGEELSKMNIALPDDRADVIMRVIHTTADFDYASTLVFSGGCIEKACELLKAGSHIITDTNMSLSGINRKALSSLGGDVHCFMADETVAAEAKNRSLTRAFVSMEKAFSIDAPLIFAVGNAPTALVSLCEQMKIGNVPKLVVGVPVGFVNVEASKDMLELTCKEYDVPYIINKGRKGGSTVAVAICNALLYMVNSSRK